MPALNDRVAIITGASSGIGEATARHLAHEGAAVVLAARREDRLKDLEAEIEDAGGKALVVPTDVTDRAACQNLIDRAVEAFGQIDILVKNAGLMPLSLVDKVKLDEWEKMVDVNVKGVLFCTAAAIPHMTEQKRGDIVNVSSVAGRRVFQGGAVYCATKYAVRAFSEGLRQELGPKYGIRVVCIEPGAVATELTDTITDEDVLKRFGKMNITPLESDDIARGILHAVTAPQRATTFEMLILPTDQAM
jgi:NADP-dependent 3-hydroxy acid dehydrogenase YdfG